MPIINRFTRLFTADINAVLDRIEEPDVLLRQAERDMAHELLSLNEQLHAAGVDLERAVEQESNARAAIAALDEELDICFAADEEDLARSLVRRKLETEKRRSGALNRSKETERRRARLEVAVTTATDKLAAMREKISIMTETPVTAAATAAMEVNIAADEIEVALLREKQMRGRA